MREQLSVAHVTWLLTRGGGGIPPVVFAHARALAEAGMRARVFGLVDRKFAGELDDAASVETVPAKPVGPLALGWAPEINRALLKYEPAVVHLHGLFTWPSQAVRSWRRVTGRPVVISPHGMLEPWALNRSRWKKRLFRWWVEDENLANAACLHALCLPEALNIRRIVPRVPIAIIPNGVECPSETRQAVDGAGAQRSDGRARLLFLGRVHPKKGLLNLVRAWAAVLRERPSVRDEWVLTITGPNQLNHASEVMAEVRRLGLDATVDITGPAYGSNKRALLASASAFVLPSYSEGFSMAVLEAMAWGLPLIVTRECNIDVSRFGGGWVCEPAVESIASALRELLAMTATERTSVASRCRAEAAANYSWERIGRQLADAYGWLEGGGASPASVQFL